MIIRFILILLLCSLWQAISPIVNIDHWQYRWGDKQLEQSLTDFAAQPGWQKTSGFVFEKRKGHRFLWLKTTLPQSEAQTLFIEGIDQSFEIYVDGQKVYDFGRWATGETPEFAGYPWHTLTLPEGKTLLLRIYSEHINIGPFGSIALGSAEEHLKKIILRDLDRVSIELQYSALGAV